MDTNTLIREARARFQHQESKQYLREKYQARLKFSEQGGLWTASPEFITFLRTTTAESIIMLDEYQKPLQVQVQTLLTRAESVYHDTMAEWHSEFEQLRTRR
jgi:hypothetical protein